MNLKETLEKFNNRIVDEWIYRLHTEVSERYCARPVDELFLTVSKANEANYAVMIHNDFSKINNHIQWITKLRLEGGFSLSEVQNAYELYRTVLLPILPNELDDKNFLETMNQLNYCLFYTITRFSNYFQSLHEKHIREYAQNLEREVEKRTKELIESESKYRILVEEINDGYFVIQNEKIVFANQAFCDMHGYSIGEILKKHYTELIAPQSLRNVKIAYGKVVCGEHTEDILTYFRQHKNSIPLPTESKIKAIRYQGEYAVAGICRDITERIEAERRIRESERLAHIGKLTTSLAHEIRNPLSSVKMNSQIILKNMEFQGYDKRRMEIIVNEISRLERILDEMLDFARPIKLNLQAVSIHKLIDSCLEVLDAKIWEKEIRVKKLYDGRLPDILADSEKMEQAIINILINSIEVLPEGGIIEIETSLLRIERRTIKIEFMDNGPGIKPEELPYIFDPFFSNKKKGTGLGLSNVKKIIEAHGGKVSVANKKPRGTKVSLIIPFKEMR